MRLLIIWTELNWNWNELLWSQNQGYSTTDSQLASPSRHQAPVWDPRPIFPFFLWLFVGSCEFVDVGPPLWREVGSVVFSFGRASPAQPFSDLSPTGLMSIVCLNFWDSPNLEGQVLVFVSPRNRVELLSNRSSQLWPIATDRQKIPFLCSYSVVSAIDTAVA
jgi:hypothetical protein